MCVCVCVGGVGVLSVHVEWQQVDWSPCLEPLLVLIRDWGGVFSSHDMKMLTVKQKCFGATSLSSSDLQGRSSSPLLFVN